MTAKALSEIRVDACNIMACLSEVVSACEAAHDQAVNASRNAAMSLPAYLQADESAGALRDASRPRARCSRTTWPA